MREDWLAGASLQRHTWLLFLVLGRCEDRLEKQWEEASLGHGHQRCLCITPEEEAGNRWGSNVKQCWGLPRWWRLRLMPPGAALMPKLLLLLPFQNLGCFARRVLIIVLLPSVWARHGCTVTYECAWAWVILTCGLPIREEILCCIKYIYVHQGKIKNKIISIYHAKGILIIVSLKIIFF